MQRMVDQSSHLKDVVNNAIAVYEQADLANRLDGMVSYTNTLTSTVNNAITTYQQTNIANRLDSLEIVTPAINDLAEMLQSLAPAAKWQPKT